MLKKDVIKLQNIKADIIDGQLILKIQVQNPVTRTLYAYGTPRRILYDNITGKLILCLHDQHLNDDDQANPGHLPEPHFVLLEGNSTTEMQLKLAPVYHRFRSAKELDENGLPVEELRVSEAKEIEIEIAHQDTPFYHNPKVGNARQFKDWGKVVTRSSFKITSPKRKTVENSESNSKTRKSRS
jgi:hypothetical protein